MRSAVPILLLCILGASLALDANQLIIQQALNGVFEENKLVDPATVMECIDSDTAAKVVAFVPKFFKKASSLFTIMGAITDAESFVKTLNTEVATCLKDNVEMIALIADYDISKVDKTAALAYVSTHLSTFTNEFAQAYKEFSNGQYNKLGNELADFAHKILTSISSKVKKFFLQASNDANQNILTQVIDGFYEQNGLADPSTIVPCIDTTTAANIVNFVPGFLKKASSALTIASAITSLQSFVQTLNPADATCLQGNAEVAELSTVFNVSGINPQTAISWVTGHVSTVTGEAATLNKLWSAGSYNAFGNNASSFVHTIISQLQPKSHKLQASNDANQNILTQVIDGFYEQNGLADPTTIVPCIDTTTAANIVNFIPGFLKKASSPLTIASALTSLQSLVQTLNPADATCLKGNAEVAELSTVFNVSGINPQAAISWATSHVSTVTGEAATLNKLWSAGSYDAFGNNVSSFVHTIISQLQPKFSEINASNIEILTAFYNGIYSQQGLPNPTFVAQCYWDAPAADFVAFAPSFLKKASSIFTINAAFQDLQDFTNDQAQKYPQIGECSQNYASELQALSDALGIKNPATVQDTIKNYITANLSSTTSAFGDANSSWKSSNYTKSGSQVSAWLKKALAKNALNLDEQLFE